MASPGHLCYLSAADDEETSSPAGEYDPKSLLVDQMEAAVSYSVKKFFLHYEIYWFISFFNDTLIAIGEQTLTPALLYQSNQELPLPTLSEACKQFETQLVPHYSSKITPDNFVEALEYIKETIFQHFHLYQFLLTQEQPTDVTTLHLPIEVPPSESIPLSQGMIEEKWLKREKVEQLKAEHALKEREMIDLHTEAEKELQDKLMEAYQTKLAKIEGTVMTPGEVSKIIETLLTAHIELLTSKVTHALQRLSPTMEARLDKIEAISAKPSNISSSSSSLGPAPAPSEKKSQTSSRVSVSISVN